MQVKQILKKSILVLFSLVVCVGLFIARPVAAQAYVISAPYAIISNNVEIGDYSTFEDALAAVQDGQILQIRETTNYNKTITISNKSITLDIREVALTVDPTVPDQYGNMSYGLVLDNATVNLANTLNPQAPAIFNVTGPVAAIYASGDSTVSVASATSPGTGLIVASDSNVDVTGNISGDTGGVSVDASNANVTVNGNVSSDAGAGVSVSGNGSSTVTVNGTVSGTTVGVKCQDASVWVSGYLGSAGDYIQVGNQMLGPNDWVTSLGYRLYTDNAGSEVRVKIPSAPVVVDRELDSITVDALPSKTVYEQGDTLDLSGLAINASYADGPSGYVTSYSTDPADGAVLDTVGQQAITVSYSEISNTGIITKTATFNITVNAKTPGSGDTGDTGNTVAVNGTDLSFTVQDGTAALEPTQGQMDAILQAPGNPIIIDMSAYGSVNLTAAAAWFKGIDKEITIMTSQGSVSMKTKELWNNSGKDRFIQIDNGHASVGNR